MCRESRKITHFHTGIFVLLFSLFLWPSLAASITLSSNTDIGTTNTNVGYTDPSYLIDASALDYIPTASGNLTPGTGNEIRYDNIIIGNGIDINIFAPDNTPVTLIANRDINIAGNLNWSGGKLSLISITGNFNLSGLITARSLTARSLVFSAGAVNLANGSKISVPGGNIRLSSPDIQPTTGGDIALSAGNISISNGNAQLNTVNKVALSAVPLPPALWLFGSGLLGLMGVFHRHNSTRLN